MCAEAPGPLSLALLPGLYCVCRLDPRDPLPEAPEGPGLFSATRTPDELSLVCPREAAPPKARQEPGWCCLAVRGPIPFDQVGVLASLAAPLAQAGVSIFALSTFDTDYLLVKEDALPRALAALKAAGHRIVD